MKSAPYRIGLLVDGSRVPKWVRDFADWANAHPQIDVAAFVIGPRPAQPAILRPILALERLFLRFSGRYRPYLRLYPVHGGAAELKGIRAAKDGCVRLAEADLAKLRALRLDLLVQCGNGMAAPALVAEARDGMLFISPGSGGAAANGAQGLIDVVEGRLETRFAIERAPASAAPPETLFTGSVSTGLSYSASTICVHARAFGYLRLVVERLARRNAEPVRNDRGLRVCQPFSSAQLLSYGARTIGRSLGKAARRLSGRDFNWRVGFTRKPWIDGDWSDGTSIANPEGSFLADPFTIAVDGTHYIFVEEFRFKDRKGVIAAYRLHGDQPKRIGIVLEQAYHLSFPFVFRHAGDIFMVPESGAGRCVKLYKSTSFPAGWQEVKVLLEGVEAVDTIMFEHRGLWWMLTTIKGQGPGLNSAELHAFHAPDPLGEWTAHRDNPVVMDARRGRNGGFLRDELGRPHRVAQIPGFTFYGAGASVFRIDELSPETYGERLVTEVRPDFLPRLDGTHHIHSADGLTVYDFLRVERPGAKL